MRNTWAPIYGNPKTLLTSICHQVITQLSIYYGLENQIDEILEERSNKDCQISGDSW